MEKGRRHVCVYGVTCASHDGFRCVRRPYQQTFMSNNVESLTMPHQCHARGGLFEPFAGQWHWPNGLTKCSLQGDSQQNKNVAMQAAFDLPSSVYLVHSWSRGTVPIHALRKICFGSLVGCFGHIAWIGITFTALLVDGLLVCLLFVYFRDSRMSICMMFFSFLMQAHIMQWPSSLKLEHKLWNLQFDGARSWVIHWNTFVPERVCLLRSAKARAMMT